jgi:hypothetical protein
MVKALTDGSLPNGEGSGPKLTSMGPFLRLGAAADPLDVVL